MKKLFLFSLFVFICSLAAAQNPQGAHFKFDAMTHDFGTIDHSLASVSHRFEFTNDGTEPLVIIKTETSCTCTKTEYDKKPVPAGGRGAITVIYEVNKKDAGVFYKAVDVYSNSVDKRISLVVRGNAVARK
jgi:hypothetical protein